LIKRIKIKIKTEDEAVPSYNWGSIMHGVLMQKLNSEYVEYLHNDGLKPFSQFILTDNCKENTEFTWVVNLLGEEAIREIMPMLQREEKYFLKHKAIYLKVNEVTIENTITEEEFCKKYLLEKEYCNYPAINFITPSTHKSAGQYTIFPSTDLIIKSLIQKWNAYSKEYSLQDEQGVADMITYTKIRNYKLRSKKYYLEGVRIPSYMGTLGLSIKGPEALMKLVNMLLHFGEYSGIGVKTSLGMGACIINQTKV